jgi:hypothetical protein
VLEYRFAQIVVTTICGKTQLLIGLNRISALILQRIGANFVQQSNTPTFLTQI